MLYTRIIIYDICTKGLFKLTKENWITSLKGLSERDLSLCERAYDTLMANVYPEDAGFKWSPYRCISPGKKRFEGLWNWDSAFHAAGVCRWDTKLAKESIYGFFKFQTENGNLPDVIFENGTIISTYTKPPVFAWAALRIYEKDNDSSFLADIYPALCKNTQYFENHRMYEGLFHYDCDDKTAAEYETFVRYESGWDNSVRWDGGITNMWAIDLNCFMVIYYKSMAKIANILGKNEEAENWDKKAKALSALINEKMWDEENGWYSDTDRFTKKVSSALSPASFMPLYAKIASNKQAEKMARIAVERFDSKMPTVSYDNPAYSTDYWRGPTWLNVAYFAAKGLRNYGHPVANDIKESILDMCHNEKCGIFENYDSKTMKGLCCDHFSWSSVFIIEFILDF